MLTNRTRVALFAIAIASSVIVASGGLVSSAFADTKKVTNQNPLSYLSFPITVGGQKSSFPMSKSANGADSGDNTAPPVSRDNSPKSQSANAGDPSGAAGDTSGISAKDLKSLSKCESGAAADGDLTQAEVTDCYRQVF
jgi:hypothetical protein